MTSIEERYLYEVRLAAKELFPKAYVEDGFLVVLPWAWRIPMPSDMHLVPTKELFGFARSWANSKTRCAWKPPETAQATSISCFFESERRLDCARVEGDRGQPLLAISNPGDAIFLSKAKAVRLVEILEDFMQRS